MRESKIEKSHCDKHKAKGGIAYKFVSPGCNGVPDRLFLFPIAKEHIDIVNKYVKFIEFKQPGKKPDPHQLKQHKKLNKLNFKVGVIDYEI